MLENPTKSKRSSRTSWRVLGGWWRDLFIPGYITEAIYCIQEICHIFNYI